MDLKFRVWDKKNFCWATDFTINLDGRLLCDNGTTIFIPEDFEVTQSFGMFDMYGKEIFIGDVVEIIPSYESKTEPDRCLVALPNGCPAIVHIGVGIYKTRDMVAKHNMMFKIIGNMYENPDLLDII